MEKILDGGIYDKVKCVSWAAALGRGEGPHTPRVTASQFIPLGPCLERAARGTRLHRALVCGSGFGDPPSLLAREGEI